MIAYVSMNKLIEFGVAFMTARGVPPDAAREASRVAVETEAFRQSTHGLAQFAAIDRELGRSIDPARAPAVARRHGATAVIDGRRCLSALSMNLARAEAIQLARRYGSGFVTVPATAWVGALGMHILPVSEAGMLCQAWAQSNTCQDCAPLGGCDPRFSTNPTALTFPADGAPVVADFSTSTMAMGAARALIDEGRSCATPRFIDHDGVPTPDPSVMDREGTLMFMGGDVDGHKGYALSLFNEALAAMAGGSAHNPEAESQQACALMVLDPAACGGAEHYAAEMRRFIRHLRSSRLRPGVAAIRLQGERGLAALAECRRRGVPLDERKQALLRNLAAANGLTAVV